MFQVDKNILITGIHRSGSTFVGKIVSQANDIYYIQEPFNKYGGVKGVDVWFKYLSEDYSDLKYDQIIKNIINLDKIKYKRNYISLENINFYI